MRAISYVNFLRDSVNRCDTLVIACVDFRFRKHLCDLLSYAGYRDFDILTFPGSSKWVAEQKHNLDLFTAVETVHRVHGTTRILVIDHIDCGAYGGSAAHKNVDEEEACHCRQLVAAYSTLKDRFPDMDVQLAYMDWQQLRPILPTAPPETDATSPLVSAE